MNRDDLLYLLKAVIFIALFIFAIRCFIYLLPVIFLVLLGMLIYDSYKKRNNGSIVKKKKDNGIKEAQVIKEKKND